jgi:hypothetical protein
MRENSRCSRAVEACTCHHAWLRFRQIPIPIASRPHCKHLPRMAPGFGAGWVIETRSLPNLLVATLATLPSMSLIPSAPLKLVRCPRSLAPTLVALPSMSLIPSAPFPICGNRRQCARCNREKDPPPPIQPSQPLRRSRRLWRDKRGGAGAGAGADSSMNTAAGQRLNKHRAR